MCVGACARMRLMITTSLRQDGMIVHVPSSQNSTKHATSMQSLSAARCHLCTRCCSACRRARSAGHRLLHGRPAPSPAKSNWQVERVACCWDSHTKLALDRVAQASRMLVQQPQRYGIAVTLAVLNLAPVSERCPCAPWLLCTPCYIALAWNPIPIPLTKTMVAECAVGSCLSKARPAPS